MIRIITTRRLQALRSDLDAIRNEARQLRAVGQSLMKEKALLEQARDFYQKDAQEWKGRAQRLIDQIGVSSGTLSSPAMTEPHAPQSAMRSVMSALAHDSLKHQTDDRPHVPAAVLGVDETAAAAAVADVLR